ncbi:MAG TPA: TerC/Alx family metal homeostasis membrane protein [Vicinamibacterales bacterium]|nr:TerC/Alx family metal homeostasis membrane protein [Vicinamibacterales bacterium]
MIVWVASSLAFGVWIFVSHGAVAAAEYYAAYFLEKSLSVDNIFVFIIIFSELRIPGEYQRRVLWYGVAGALVLRALLIGAGVALIGRVDWVIYPFGALILLAAWRMLFGAERERKVVKEACNVCETWIARVLPVSPVLRGHEFWRRENGRLVATPLLVALVVIETTDIVFALDSVPAVLAITRNPLIVYSSNIMAMLGLRSLYFVLSDVITRLRYLRHGLALLLAFTGTKMLAGDRVHIGPGTSVLVIGLVLLVTIAASVVAGPPATHDSRTASI